MLKNSAIGITILVLFLLAGGFVAHRAWIGHEYILHTNVEHNGTITITHDGFYKVGKIQVEDFEQGDYIEIRGTSSFDGIHKVIRVIDNFSFSIAMPLGVSLTPEEAMQGINDEPRHFDAVFYYGRVSRMCLEFAEVFQTSSNKVTPLETSTSDLEAQRKGKELEQTRGKAEADKAAQQAVVAQAAAMMGEPEPAPTNVDVATAVAPVAEGDSSIR